jgi:hypothetical protein
MDFGLSVLDVSPVSSGSDGAQALRNTLELAQKLRVSSYEDLDLVFATGKGTPLDAQNIVNRHFKPLLERAGLPLFVGTISGTHALPCF